MTAGSCGSNLHDTSQIGHPYQGNNYFNAGRANGLPFYESAALNDFINTTLGGITLGEVFHRTGWLIRNTSS